MTFIGSGGVWAMKSGDFQATNFAGTGAGVIAACAYAASGGMVFIGPGTYTLTSAISVTGGLSIEGAGRDVTILHYPNTGVDGVNITTGSRMAHLTLRGPNALSVGFAGVDSGSVNDVTIEDCIIEKWGDAGINTGGSSARWNIYGNIVRDNFQQGIFIASNTTDCIVSSNIVTGNASIGIDCNGQRNVISKNVVRLNGGTGGSVDRWGILLAGISGANADFNVVSGNFVSANGAQGIIIRAETGQSANYNLIFGNTSISNTGSGNNGDGIAIDGSSGGTHVGNKINNNLCRNNQRDGIIIDDATSAAISNTDIHGNSCFDNTAYGIRLSHGTGTMLDTMILDNIALSNVAGQILDGGTRTLLAGNKTTIADGDYLIGGGTFNTGHLQLGTQHLWVEAATGKLRIKSSAPTSDADGTVVGTQV